MKKILLTIIAMIIVAAVSFWGGTKYTNSKELERTGSMASSQNFRNMSAEERQQMMQQFGADVTAGFRGNRAGQRAEGGFASGEIISKDAESITLKLQDAGSKLIFFSNSTKITKSAEGTADDLSVGKQITATGTPNQDGTLTAQTIQLRELRQQQNNPQ